MAFHGWMDECQRTNELMFNKRKSNRGRRAESSHLATEKLQVRVEPKLGSAQWLGQLKTSQLKIFLKNTILYEDNIYIYMLNLKYL